MFSVLSTPAKRLAVLASLLALLALAGLHTAGTHATAQEFTIQSLDCTSTPGHIQIQNTSAGPTDLGGLAVVLAPAGGPSTTLNVNAALGSPPAVGFTVTGNAVIDLQVGHGATTSPPPF